METMSAEEFASRVDEILVDANLAGQRWEQPLPGTRRRWDPDVREPKAANGLLVQWSTGGAQGGNCWNNDGAQSYTTGNGPEELTSLEVVIEKLFPDMTHRTFRQLERLVEAGNYSEREYYGNHTNYQFRFVSLDKVYRFLVEQGLIVGPEASCGPR